jgi:6-phospho-3-hexuloisomerase
MNTEIKFTNIPIFLKEQEELWFSINKDNYSWFVNSLYQTINSVAEKNIIGIGAGRMGYALQGFMMRLSHLGYNAFMLGDTTVPRLKKDDIIIINSSSGETPSVCLMADIARKTGAKIFTITTDPFSYLAIICDFVLYYGIKYISRQPMKTAYEQFTWSLFDQIVYEFLNYSGYSTLTTNGTLYNYRGISIDENHSILE